MTAVSARKGDKHYRPDFWQYEALCDGTKLENCIYANEESGIAEVFLTDPDGRKIERPDGSGLMTKTVRGKIQLRKTASFIKT